MSILSVIDFMVDAIIIAFITVIIHFLVHQDWSIAVVLAIIISLTADVLRRVFP
jgi:hypothetical protein